MIFVVYYHSTLHIVGTVADGANIKAFARRCLFYTLPRNRLEEPLLHYQIKSNQMWIYIAHCQKNL